jgi:SAM-dependent methyltransferase
MLLTITYTGENPGDLGYLLHKNPARPQTVELGFGRAHVFYPELSAERCTAALLLDIDPLDLARGKLGSKEGGLFDYVNDRPYVSSSFMSTSLSRVYGTAMAGRCEKRQELADTPLDLSAALTMLPCRGSPVLLNLVFEPLGYEVEFETDLLDETFPDWGQSRCVNVSIRGKVRLRDLLRHLYVLIPVFDRQKHYWFGQDEIDKLLSHGEGWLEDHPEKEFITRRYFKNHRSLTRKALDRLDAAHGSSLGEMMSAEGPEMPEAIEAVEENDGTEETEEIGETGEIEKNNKLEGPKRKNLNTRRLEAVLAALKESGARQVIDLGCGEGNLLRLLLREKSFTKIAGTDVSRAVLERAAERLKLNPAEGRLTLFQSSLNYRDKRFKGYDAATVVEVIEHIDENQLNIFAAILFGDAAPRIIIVTTPNIEYNENYFGPESGPPLLKPRFRHGDHRFEWTRKQFRCWAEAVAEKYGYGVRYEEIGDLDEERGAPTQMGVFTKCE